MIDRRGTRTVALACSLGSVAVALGALVAFFTLFGRAGTWVVGCCGLLICTMSATGMVHRSWSRLPLLLSGLAGALMSYNQLTRLEADAIDLTPFLVPLAVVVLGTSAALSVDAHRSVRTMQRDAILELQHETPPRRAARGVALLILAAFLTLQAIDSSTRTGTVVWLSGALLAVGALVWAARRVGGPSAREVG